MKRSLHLSTLKSSCQRSITSTCDPAMASAHSLLLDYEIPVWAKHLEHPPTQKVNLACLPTPVLRWNVPFLQELGIEWWIKRDDLTGFELGGNKVRKLEFLLADAISKGHDCVVTIGGIQSNHCRATAAAACQLGLETHIILRTESPDEDPGLVGNLLIDRMVGATIHTVSTDEYRKHGSESLTDNLATQLKGDGKKPYVIPVGGSNALGTWGYIQGVAELSHQMESKLGENEAFDHIAFACGSGGTAAGISLGVDMAAFGSQVHGVCVCDTPEVFYEHIDHEYKTFLNPRDSEFQSKNILEIHQGKNEGYAKSTPEELQQLIELSQKTGILLDPVYSGKAFIKLLEVIQNDPDLYRRKKILFWHTGGAFGMYDKIDQLSELLPTYPSEKVRRLQV